MREEVRVCPVCAETTMHRRRLLARKWTCERCEWKAVADDRATTMVHLFEYMWLRTPPPLNPRYRPKAKAKSAVDER